MENVPIVDYALEHDQKFSIKTYPLIVRNALYMLSINNNLIPPFLMWEARILMNDVARINCGEDVYHKSDYIFQEED